MSRAMAKGSVETKINWVKDVDKFEKRLATGDHNRVSRKLTYRDPSKKQGIG
jgi:hypothetical protein